jgi:hypothetical protein
MKHRATPRFWSCYRALPSEIQQLADRSYELLRSDSRYPSLHFKKVGQFWSARVGLHYRALAVESDEEMIWVWIGTHAEYDRLLQLSP